MKICVAQTQPIKGDIQSNIESNIENHKKIIDLAIANRANIVIFPELSITGYEPGLAEALATNQDDSRFDDFQKIADGKQIAIGIGVPTRNTQGICISMVIFQPHQPRQTYSKQYIHSDEEEFFISGQNSISFINNTDIALAICYELSVLEHAENAFKNGAEIYIASVAKSADGVNRAAERLSKIAEKYSMTTLMSNCIGQCDGFEGGGRSAIWNSQGLLIGQLNDMEEGILIIDTDTEEVRSFPIGV
jgi:predicted amidohydrolase